MLKIVAVLALAAASAVPARAATTITLNTPAQGTSLPDSTKKVIQTFTTGNANNSALAPGTNVAVPGSQVIFSEAVGGKQPENVLVFDASLAVPPAPAVPSMEGDFLRIGNQSSYTITFVRPVAFFSFAFSNLVNNTTLTLTYVAGDPLELRGPSEILGQDVGAGTSGRVSYDVGHASRITSATFFKNGANTFFSIDDIAAAVPEPATWLTMLLGFGLVGSQLRRRQRNTRIATA